MNEKREWTGIWIPKEIWLNRELSLFEKILLIEISSLDNDFGCIATNEYFAKFFDKTPERISQVVANLLKKEFIFSTIKENYKRTIKVNKIKFFSIENEQLNPKLNNKDIEINKELKNNKLNKEKYKKEDQPQDIFTEEELLFEEFYKLYNSLEKIIDSVKITQGYNKTKHKFISKIKNQNINFKYIIDGTKYYLHFIELSRRTGFNRDLKDIDTFINQCSWEGDKGGISWNDKIIQKLNNVSKIINTPTINEFKKDLKEQELYKINTDIPF